MLAILARPQCVKFAMTVLFLRSYDMDKRSSQPISTINLNFGDQNCFLWQSGSVKLHGDYVISVV